MPGSLESLYSPAIGSAVVTSAIVLAHACAGAGAVLLALDCSSHARAWPRADRILLLVAFAVGLPSMAFALLNIASSSRDPLLLARAAFGPLLAASTALPIVWLLSWAVRTTTRSVLIARIAGGVALASAACGILIGAAVAAWSWNPAAWIEARSLRSAVASPWLVPMLLVRGSGAIAIGGACVWALIAPQLETGGGRRTAAVSAAAMAVTSLCLAVLCFVFSARLFYDPWLGVPALFGPHGARSQRLLFVALAASSSAAAIATAAARGAVRYRFAPAGAAALSLIALLCFEQARSTSVRPWALPGLLYANGTSVERAQLQRRTARVNAPAGASKDAVGEAMFSLQCRTCHGVARLRLQAAERGFPETRTLLERLREADQLGSPWRGVMPPLVGSDDEIDSMARWICGRP